VNYVSDSRKEMLSQKCGPCRVFIIAGFLGSGKTTLLKNLLEWEIAHGQRPYVIMSEFGDIDIDGILVSDHRIELTSIFGGCVCCDLRDELARSLLEITRKEPGSTVFIESTGIADPAGIVVAIEPIVRSGAAVIGNVIVVYDAGRHPLLGPDKVLVKDQLFTADTILVNKSDLAAPVKIQEILVQIAELNAGAELIVTGQGRIDAENILNKVSCIKIPTGAKSTSKSFCSLAFQIGAPLSRKALEKWLKMLPPSVIRVKGFVRLADKSGFFEVQAVCGQMSITSFDSVQEPPSILVLVAHPMRTDGLVRRLNHCLAQAN
jgi:G3E family GTPase